MLQGAQEVQACGCRTTNLSSCHELGRDAMVQWIREQAAAGFVQLDAGEFEDLAREELMARLT